MTDERTKTRILEAAGELFAEKGFAGATVRAICDRAVAGLVSINYYFGNKEQLYIETLKFAHQVHDEPPAWGDEAKAEDKLRMFIVASMTQMVQHRDNWRTKLLLREMMSPSEPCRQMLEEMIRSGYDFLLPLLGELLPKGTPKHKRLKFAFSLSAQMHYYAMARFEMNIIAGEKEIEKNFGPNQIADHILQFMLAAIAAEDDRASKRKHK